MLRRSERFWISLSSSWRLEMIRSSPLTERMRVDLGLETNRGRRFALWSLLYMLGAAPDLDVAFEDTAERDAARDFMDMIDRSEGG